MGKVETFEHTADLGLRIEASSLADLFETAAVGLFRTIVANLESVHPLESEQVVLESDSTPALLVSWINELIFRSETRHMLYTRFRVDVNEPGLRLEARIEGEPIASPRHVLDHEVKAATWHGLSVTNDGSLWSAEVILDI